MVVVAVLVDVEVVTNVDVAVLVPVVTSAAMKLLVTFMARNCLYSLAN